MAEPGRSTRFSAVQEIGGAPNEAQTDRIRVGAVRTAAGRRILLGVVADGAGAADAEAASRAVEQVFQVVEQSRPRELGDLAAVLRRGLEIANRGLRKTTGRAAPVGATAAAIWRNRLYYAHIGHTVAFRVSNGRAEQLVPSSTGRLGATESPEIHTGTLQLQRGDRIVLASDGVIRRSPHTGEAFVEQTEIAQHASELPPSQAARHLVSLALGRDVDDNVSVAVMALPGRARTERRFPWAAAGVGFLLLGLAAAGAAILLRQPGAAATTDYGFAVLVEGGVLADQGSGTPELVPSLGTIPGASFLTASTDAKLGLQSTFAGGSAVSEGNLYLEQNTGLQLTAIDPRAATAEPAPQGTDLTIVSGRLLILRESGTWEFRVNGHGYTASLIGVGRGAIGVVAASDELSLHCLVGICGFGARGSERQVFQAGELIRSPGRPSGVTAEALAAELVRWDTLCQGCILTGR